MTKARELAPQDGGGIDYGKERSMNRNGIVVQVHEEQEASQQKGTVECGVMGG